MSGLEDDHVVDAIKQYVRNEPNIEVYQYIRRGSNGEVYFGRRTKMGDEVVLKFYWSHPNYDETEEAVILRKIDHPNILKIYDLKFIKPYYACFVTPKISGGDVQALIDKQDLSSKQSLDIISGILSGATELHSKHKLVHRDFKPGNILYDLEKHTPIVADLGAVKKIDSVENPTTASKATYFYLPPESISNNEYYYQSDIYQIGLILFQLLGGYFPINDPCKWLKARDLKQLETIRNSNDRDHKFDELIGKKILNGTLADTDTLPYYVDASFKRVLNKALHADHRKRYKDASQFLIEIHQLLRAHPDYKFDGDRLIVTHQNGKQCQLFKNRHGLLEVEKRSSCDKAWRNDNSHKGDVQKALEIARKK